MRFAIVGVPLVYSFRSAACTGKHGTPFALIGAWFNPEIYAAHNAGWWYDIGFVIGILVLGSGTVSSL